MIGRERTLEGATEKDVSNTRWYMIANSFGKVMKTQAHLFEGSILNPLGGGGNLE